MGEKILPGRGARDEEMIDKEEERCCRELTITFLHL